jgi:hypothetical protein
LDISLFALLVTLGDFQHDQNDQKIFIISHGEIVSRSSVDIVVIAHQPIVVEARIEPSTCMPVVERYYQLRYPAAPVSFFVYTSGEPVVYGA